MARQVNATGHDNFVLFFDNSGSGQNCSLQTAFWCLKGDVESTQAAMERPATAKGAKSLFEEATVHYGKDVWERIAGSFEALEGLFKFRGVGIVVNPDT